MYAETLDPRQCSFNWNRADWSEVSCWWLLIAVFYPLGLLPVQTEVGFTWVLMHTLVPQYEQWFIDQSTFFRSYWIKCIWKCIYTGFRWPELKEYWGLSEFILSSIKSRINQNWIIHHVWRHSVHTVKTPRFGASSFLVLFESRTEVSWLCPAIKSPAKITLETVVRIVQ